MKNKIILSIIALLVLVFFVFTEVNDYIDDMNEQMKIKDERIENLIKSDSIVSEKTKKYSETITKYISDCTISVDDKKYSLEEFIDLYIDEINKKNKLNDSLIKIKLLYDASVEKYGKPYRIIKKNDSTIALLKNNTKTDTALAYFDNRGSFENFIYKTNDSFYAYKSMLNI